MKSVPLSVYSRTRERDIEGGTRKPTWKTARRTYPIAAKRVPHALVNAVPRVLRRYRYTDVERGEVSDSAVGVLLRRSCFESAGHCLLLDSKCTKYVGNVSSVLRFVSQSQSLFYRFEKSFFSVGKMRDLV